MKTLRTLSLLSLALLISVPAFAMDANPVDIDSMSSSDESVASVKVEPVRVGPAEEEDTASGYEASMEFEKLSANRPKPGFFARSLNAVKGALTGAAAGVTGAAKTGYNKTLKPYTQTELDARKDKNEAWANSFDNATKAGAAKKWTAEQYAKTSSFFANHRYTANGLYYTGLVTALAAVTYGVKKAYDWAKSKWSKNPVDQQLIAAANIALTEKKPCVVDAMCGLNIQDDVVLDALTERALAIDATIAGYNDASNKEDREDLNAVAQAQVEEFNNFVKTYISSGVVQNPSEVSTK